MEKPPQSVILNVCIMPSLDVGIECVKISQALNQEEIIFSLGKERFPHMTVFMARFSDEKIPQVMKVLEDVIKSVVPFRCRHSGYFKTAGGYLEVSYEKTQDFINFHKLVMDRLSPLRINPGQPYEESYFAPYTQEQRLNAETTGYDLANELYRPHITLTRYKEDRVPQELPSLPDANLSFDLQQIGIYKADDNGAVYEEIKSYELST